MRRHESSEAQWNKIKDLLPPERKSQGGRQAGKEQSRDAQCHGVLAEHWLFPKDLAPDKAYTIDFVYGQKPAYGRTFWRS